MPPKPVATKKTATKKTATSTTTTRSKAPPMRAHGASKPAKTAAAPAAKAEYKPVEIKMPDPIPVVVKEIKNVFIEDKQRQIRDTESPAALVIDNDEGIAGRFMVYSGAVMMEGLQLIKNPSATEEEKEKIRLSAMNAVRQGKPLIIDIDLADYDVFMEICKRFEDLAKGLMDALLDRSIIKNMDKEWHDKLVLQSDGEGFQRHYFQEDTMDKFFVVLLTKNQSPSKELASKFTVFKIEN